MTDDFLDQIDIRTLELGTSRSQMIRACLEEVLGTLTHERVLASAVPALGAPHEACVYFVRETGPRGLIKIGYAKNVKSLTKMGFAGTTRGMVLMKAIYGGRPLADMLTARFARFAVKQTVQGGWWFQAEPELLAYISSLPGDNLEKEIYRKPSQRSLRGRAKVLV